MKLRVTRLLPTPEKLISNHSPKQANYLSEFSGAHPAVTRAPKKWLLADKNAKKKTVTLKMFDPELESFPRRTLANKNGTRVKFDFVPRILSVP